MVPRSIFVPEAILASGLFYCKESMDMRTIRISDMTMKQTGQELSLSFREKIELAKLLDKLDVSVIELEGIANAKIDALRIKSIASAVQHSVVAVPVALDGANLQQVWNALKD